MAEIDEQVRLKVLAVYNPKQRILLGGTIDYPKARGIFKIGPCFYAIGDFNHATDIEIQLCLNQLLYSTVYQAINDKSHPYFDNKDFDKLQKEGMLIAESRKRFRKFIPTDREIYAEINIVNLRKRKNLVFANVDFDFENRSCIGELELVILDN